MLITKFTLVIVWTNYKIYNILKTLTYSLSLILFTDYARVVRETNDDGNLMRHRRELPEETEDKTKAKSKVVV